MQAVTNFPRVPGRQWSNQEVMTSPAQLEQHHTYHFNENYTTDITEAEDLLVRAAASQSKNKDPAACEC